MSILHFSNFSLEARNGEEGVSYNVLFLTAHLLHLLPTQTVSIETDSP